MKAALATCSIAVALAMGCATGVKQADLDTQLAAVQEQVRTEMSQMKDAQQSVDAQQKSDIDALNRRMDSMDQALQAFQRDTRTTITRLQDQVKFEVPVYFEYDDATLRTQDKPILDRFSQVAKEYYPTALITVEGFADPAGDAEYNIQLGMRRAETVRQYLVGTGLPDGLVKAVSYGEARDRQVIAGAHGPGDAGMENRRVVLVIDYSGGAPLAAR